MPISSISQGLAIGGGAMATSSGAGGGGPTLVNEYSVDFDGADDYMNVNSSGTLGSFSLWFKSAAEVSKSSGGQYLFSFTANASAWGNVALGLSTGSATDELITVNQGNRAYAYTSASASINTDWHHLAARWTGSTYEIYLDGTQVKNAEGGTGTAAIISFSSLRIAAYPSYFPYAYEGLLDEVAIWATPLSASDITAIYNGGTPTFLASYSPVNFWRMGDNDGGTGTTITDEGSAGDDGTLTNGPTFSTTVP